MRWLAIGSLAMLACSSDGPTKEAPPPSQPAQRVQPSPPPGAVAVTTTSSKPGASGLVTMLRPLVANVAAGDPLTMAVHWENTSGPIPGHRDFKVDRAKTVASLVFTVKTPSGADHEIRAAVTDHMQKRYAYGLYYAPTLLLSLSAQGLAESQKISGPWTGSAPSLASVGTYSIGLSGRIVSDGGKEIEFVAAPVSIAVGGRGLAKRADLLAAAEKAVDDKTPRDAPNVIAGAESGFVRDLVIENEKGERVVRIARQGKTFRWGYDLYSVTLAADGTVKTVDKQEIGTCVAAGTLIETPKGPTAVENLERGDLVWGVDVARGRRVATRVLSIRPAIAESTVVVGKLRATASHPIRRDGRWTRAGSVPDAPIIREPVTVFQIDVAPPDTFIAGGVISHNKDRGYWPQLDDPWFLMWEPEALKRR